MDFDQLTEIVTSEQITTLLFHLKKPNSKITLWQKLDSARITQCASLVRINLQSHELEFFPKKGTFGFTSQLPLYFVSSNRLTIFKCSIKLNSNFKLIVGNPEKLLLKEERESARENYLDSKVAIQYGYGTDKNYVVDHQLLKSKLIDLSTRGLAFKVSKNSVIPFKRGENIFIKTSNLQHNTLINGKINYIQRYVEKDVSSQFYRIGVKFDEVQELNTV